MLKLDQKPRLSNSAKLKNGTSDYKFPCTPVIDETSALRGTGPRFGILNMGNKH